MHKQTVGLGNRCNQPVSQLMTTPMDRKRRRITEKWGKRGRHTAWSEREGGSNYERSRVGCLASVFSQNIQTRRGINISLLRET